jgi:hypothetical protein
MKALTIGRNINMVKHSVHIVGFNQNLLMDTGRLNRHNFL